MRQSGARHTLIAVALVHVGLLSAVVRGQADQSSTADDASSKDAQATQSADEIPAEYSIDDGPKEVLDEDSVFKQVAPQRRIRDFLLEARLLDTIDMGWRHLNDELDRRYRLRFGFAYTALAQGAPRSDAGKQGIGGDLDFTGVWHLLGSHEEGNAGYLGFATEWRHKLGPRPPSALAGEFEAFSLTTQAFNVQDFSLVQLWWSQELFDDTLEITAGKVSPRSFYNTNRLRNQNVAFLNQVFSGNRAVGLPGRGLGVNIVYRPAATWYLTGGIHDANGTATVGNFGSLSDGQFAYIAEFGWTPTFEELGRGNYRLTLWHSDPSRERGTDEGTGFALSLDQDIGDDLIGFLRYAYADGDARGARQTLSGGIAISNLFDRKDDLVGIGIGWSEPSEETLNEEFVAEVFYRLQLTGSQQLTFGWQSYITPAFDPSDDIIGVFSLRWRIQL